MTDSKNTRPIVSGARIAAFAFLTLTAVGCAGKSQPDVRPEVAEASAVEVAEPAGPSATGTPDPDLLALSDSAAAVAALIVESDEPEDEFASEDITAASRDELSLVRPTAVGSAAEVFEPDAPTIDIPIVINDKVLFWIDYYSKRHPAQFEPGLVRSGAYVPLFRQIFAEAGLPQDLVYMAHVESAFKDNAYSRARAMGIWQFISSTATHYGLQIDYWVDERRDPEKSARAAAAYLKKLYGDFGDWHLAMAAYNGGEGRVGRALKRTGETDFWGLAETKSLRLETRNYVPAILAATLIHKDPQAYGFDFTPTPEIAYETIRVDGAVDLQVLAECAGADFESMRKLNPMLRRDQTPPNATTDVRVPVGTGEQALLALNKVPTSDRVLYVRHTVRPGDTLYDLARSYNVTVGAIQQANAMGRNTMIREGKTLTIPTVAAGRYAGNRPTGGSSPAVEVPAGSPVTVRVRRGDTLSHIATRYGTTPAAIAAVSDISVHQVLQIGQRLTVVPGARSQATARAAVSGTVMTASNRGGGGPLVHKVRRGDTLWKIANRYSTTVDSLCQLNRIDSSQTLYPGTELTVAR